MRRDPRNPIITPRDIPTLIPALRDPSAVFNPGAVRHDGYDLLMLRVQTRGRETVLVPAALHDDDRIDFFDAPAAIHGIEAHPERIYHIYDPRLTRIEGDVIMTFAADVDGACRLGTARMDSPTDWQLLGIDATRDSRNGVLFPRRFDDAYLRLERPNRRRLDDGPRTGSTIHTATSADLITWTLGNAIMSGRPHFWDELIGSGPPPILTDSGWLHIYHGVATHFASSNIYQAGVCLLDRGNPAAVLARGAMNILEPRDLHELVGQVPNVVFPSGIIVDDNAADVRIYYGAADTVVCRARTTIDELLGLCDEPGVAL